MHIVKELASTVVINNTKALNNSLQVSSCFTFNNTRTLLYEEEHVLKTEYKFCNQQDICKNTLW